jgi:hypothetical protein
MPLVPRSWASYPVNSSTIKARKATNKLATLIALYPTDNPVQSLPLYPLLLLHPWPLFPLSSICNNKSTDCQARRLSTFLPTCSFRLVQLQTTRCWVLNPRCPTALAPHPNSIQILVQLVVSAPANLPSQLLGRVPIDSQKVFGQRPFALDVSTNGERLISRARGWRGCLDVARMQMVD